MPKNRRWSVIVHNYKRFEGESDDELIYRITGEKDKIGTWQDVTDILNDILGRNSPESTYRKRRQDFDRMFKTYESKCSNVSEQLEELKLERQSLEREKVKFRDERNEYNRLIRQEARKESYLDLVVRTMVEHDQFNIDCNDVNIYRNIVSSDNDLIIHCTDIHNGIKINNWFNKYNQDEIHKRFKRFSRKILEIARRHNSQNAYLIIGEIISGLIHENLRCSNNQNLIEQFLSVSDVLSEFIIELSKMFKEVHVYVTPGNHSRISPKKEDNLKGENFDNLLIPFLSERLQNIKNIHCHKNDIIEDIAMFNVRGNKIFSSHGDKDKPENVVQRFTLLFDTVPDIVYLGHRHRNGLTTVYNTKIVETGCISGVDDHTLDSLRVNTRPEQTVSVITAEGLECLYDIQLN